MLNCNTRGTKNQKNICMYRPSIYFCVFFFGWDVAKRLRIVSESAWDWDDFQATTGPKYNAVRSNSLVF